MKEATGTTWTLLAACLAAATMLLAGCDTADDGGASGKPLVEDGRTVLRKGNGAEPQTLDPHRAAGVPAANILRDLFEGLVSEAPDGSLIPGAAESWEIRDDGRTYLFDLRDDARWSNGDPVTARDFVFSLRRSADPATGSHYSLILSPIVNAKAVVEGRKPPESLGVEAVDQDTLRIRLNSPTPYFLGLLTHSTTYPVHPASVREHEGKFARPGRLVSNGAYRLDDWVVQSHITLVRNEQYWGDADTAVDKVVYHAITDASSELKRYRAGELDWTSSVPTSQFQWAKRNLGDQLKTHPYLGTYYYGYNLTRPPFEDAPKLREALSLAIDRSVITNRITAAGEIPAYGWVPPAIDDYQPPRLDYAEWSQARRNERARELYREAGYSEDDPLEVEIRYNTQEDHKKIAVAISQMWKSVLGVETTLHNEEWKVFLQNRQRRKVTEVFRAGWIGDYNDPYTFLDLMHSDHGINDTGYGSPEYDALLARIASETDGGTRRELMRRAERTMLADHPMIPIFYYVNKRLVKPWVEGYQGNIMDHHYSKNLEIAVPEPRQPER